MYTAEYTINKKKEKLVKEKLLTIGIITKNECEKLERCLKSLMPLKEALDCEIIVTDTGSTDNTVEMAQNYADKILHFEWCNDFAAARNTGIKAAKGLWFMWIDSDEWLENPEGLIEFFKSGDYKRYDTGVLKFFDYTEEGTFAESFITRLYINLKTFCFEGKIHEGVYFVSNKIINIDTNLLHDGYIYKDENEENKKHLRNIEPLLELYNKNNNDLETIRYLANEYSFYRKYEEAIEFCDKGIDVIKNKGDKKTIIDVGFEINLKVVKASSLIRLNQFESSRDVLLEITDETPEYSFQFLTITYILSKSYEFLGDRENALYFAKKYVDYYNKQDKMDKRYITVFKTRGIRREVVKEMWLKSIDYFYEKNYDLDTVLGYLENFRIQNDIYRHLSKNEYFVSLFKIVSFYKNYDLVLDLYKAIFLGRVEFEIEIFEKYIWQWLEAETEIENFLKKLSVFEFENILVIFAKYIIADKKNEKQIAKIMLEKLKVYLNEEHSNFLFSHVINGMIRYDFKSEQISEILKRKSNINSLNMVSYIDKNDYFDLVFETCEYYRKNKMSINFELEYFIVMLLEQVLFESDDEDVQIRIYNFFEEVVPSLLEYMYNPQNIEVIMPVIPPLFKFGFYINLANIAKIEKKVSDYVKYLKSAVKAYPLIGTPIKNILETLENKMLEESNREKELLELAKGVKQKIYELITMEQNEEALSVICQLQSIIPDDMELKELKSRILSK